MAGGDSRTLHAHIPEAVYALVAEKGQQKGPLISRIVTRYISDPEAIAENAFYHFKESPGRKSEHDVSLKMSDDDKAQFYALANALNVAKSDLISNALIRHFKPEMESIPYTQMTRRLEYDPQELERLTLPARLAAAGASAAEKAHPASEPPLVQGYTVADLNRVIAETGDRSPHVAASRHAEREERKRINYVIPEWKK
jgi:hypothetical protein